MRRSNSIGSMHCYVIMNRKHAFSVDERNRLLSLFWADLISRYDFATFRDVVKFDACYGKNKYWRPVVMMIGTNNHRRTTVYMVVLLCNENTNSYC